MPDTRPLSRPQLSRSERTQITCPGCGRHDFVSWPAEQPIYHWKCFNCSKEFDLTRDEGH